jgi:hypothetical protein
VTSPPPPPEPAEAGDDTRAALLGVGGVSAVAAAGYAAFGSARYTADFTQLWAATRAALVGVSPYDDAGVSALVPAGAEWVFLPWAYPPWTVLCTLPLGALPLDAAGRCWSLASAGGFVLAGYLASGATDLRTRAGVLAASALSLPALGVIGVGQLVAPVAVGAALLTRPSSAAVAVGLALLATKPHLGAPIALAHLAWALARRHRPSAAGWGAGVGIGLVAAIASLRVDPGWPTTWPAALHRLRATETVSVCDTCASATTSFLGAGLPGLAGLSLVAALAAALAWRGRARFEDPAVVVGAGALGGLLFLPYLRNYDHALACVPLAVAASRGGPGARWWLAGAWALPWLGASLGRAGGAPFYWLGALVGLAALLSPPTGSTPAPLEPRLHSEGGSG